MQLETQSLGRKDEFARGVISDQNARRNAEIAQKRLEAQQAHWTATEQQAVKNAQAAGWRLQEDENTGISYLIKPDGKGGVAKLEVGKTGQSIPEATSAELAKYNREQSGRIKITQMQQEGANKRTEDTLAGANMRNQAVIAAGMQNNAATQERIKTDPQRVNADRIIKMKEVAAQNSPEDVEEYFVLDENKQVVGLKPGDPNDPDYIKLYKYVYGMK